MMINHSIDGNSTEKIAITFRQNHRNKRDALYIVNPGERQQMFPEESGLTCPPADIDHPIPLPYRITTNTALISYANNGCFLDRQ